MARSVGRGASTGRFVSKATVARSPRTTVTESGSNKGSAARHRSAITGHYVTKATAQRHPGTTITENG